MLLKVLSTGSSGNCYLLENDSECLIIDVGIKFSVIKQALSFNLSKVVGALQGHRHLDHCKGSKEALNAGIDVYMSSSDKDFFNITHHRARTIEAKKEFKVGSFTVKPFDLQHDVPCLGFLIHHQECGNTIYISDTMYCKYTFRNLHNIIIEANYSHEISRINLSDMEFLRNRVMESHMSLDTCIEFLRNNDLSQVNNVVLVHLSNGQSDEVLFRTEVEKATGKTVTVADNGLVMPLNKTPF